jgi:hypothetical protein
VGVRKLAGALALAALLVPAASAAGGPANDNRANAAPIVPPDVVAGTTVGSTLEPRDPKDCGRLDGTVWYRLEIPGKGRYVVRLQAGGKLDAVVATYNPVRSRLERVGCDATDDKGRAATDFTIDGAGEVLVLVGQRHESDPGPFKLTVFRATPPAAPPGTPLPAGGVRSQVDSLGKTDEAWSVTMAAGTTYRYNLVSFSDACLTLELFQPGVTDFEDADPVASLDCNGYDTFTPGPDGGGRYSIRVSADTEAEPGPQHYRLQVAQAGLDDIGPGIPLANDHTRRGRLSGLGIDVVDLYRFDIASTSDVSLGLRAGPRARFDLEILTDTGRRVGCVCDDAGPLKFRKMMRPGRYVVSVSARGHSGGRYGLSLLIRGLTSTDVTVAGSHDATISPGSAATLSATVSSGQSGGYAEVQVDRLDPLTGWEFLRLYRLPVSGGSASVSWRPPAVGHYRVRATFLGTRTESPSRSRYAFLLVAAPLG